MVMGLPSPQLVQHIMRCFREDLTAAMHGEDMDMEFVDDLAGLA